MVYYKGNKKIKIEMKDEIPDFHFEVDEKLMKAILLPNSKTKLSYFVTPTKRELLCLVSCIYVMKENGNYV